MWDGRQIGVLTDNQESLLSTVKRRLATSLGITPSQKTCLRFNAPWREEKTGPPEEKLIWQHEERNQPEITGPATHSRKTGQAGVEYLWKWQFYDRSGQGMKWSEIMVVMIGVSKWSDWCIICTLWIAYVKIINLRRHPWSERHIATDRKHNDILHQGFEHVFSLFILFYYEHINMSMQRQGYETRWMITCTVWLY